MFFMYILRSKKNGKYYVGATHCLEKRLRQHNAGKIRSTKGLIPLEIVYSESYTTNSEARKRESCLKRRKSRKFIESLITTKNYI
ncbi:MAG: GIY-YIG nuclease family protein [Candidatus Margulisbacteria bacterium]|nr:GIY-YIG nuclease family protein [Candidatus Margulisiibacteriota bacterium]MBU1616929.1 GIY-YIG nuclease family protein [Candidatus Margulisiibacteriota bacterium]